MNDTSPGPAVQLTHGEIKLIILGVVTAMFLAALDQTIVATALPTIGRELGDAELLPWIVTSYLVTSTAVTPLYGKFSDTHGRRATLLFGIGLFTIGSIACALAPSMLALIAARAVQGLGGGGLISLSQTIIADVVAPRERGRYQVYIASVFVSTSLLGPLLGGLFAEHLHWSFIFWINLPIGALSLAMTYTLLKRLPRHDRKHSLDILGAVLLIAATGTLMLALNWGGVRHGWASPTILGLFAGSALLWIAFGLRLGRADEPLIPLNLFANPVLRMGTAAALFGMGVFIGLTIYVPAFFEIVLGLSAADSGLALIPMMVGTVFGATLAGRAMTKMAHYKRLPMAGLAMAIAATGFLAFRAHHVPFAVLQVLLTLTSIGLGTILPVTTVAIQNAVSSHQMGTATGAMNFARSLGGALIVAAFGAILLGGGVAGGLHGAPAGGPAATPGVTAAFGWMFAAAALGLTCALAALAAMEERPLRSGRDAGPATEG
jgi:EmrB/QacA subfamily drug resistance transporter